jgi:hypothetical protein
LGELAAAKESSGGENSPGLLRCDPFRLAMRIARLGLLVFAAVGRAASPFGAMIVIHRSTRQKCLVLEPTINPPLFGLPTVLR